MKKMTWTVLATAGLLYSCGAPSNPINTLSNDKQIHDSISVWLDVKNGYISSNQVAINDDLEGNLNSLQRAERTKKYPFRDYDVDIVSMKSQAGKNIVVAKVLERLGYSENQIEKGGRYTYKFTLEQGSSGWTVYEVAEEVLPNQWVTTSDRASFVESTEGRKLIRQGFESHVTPVAQAAWYNASAARTYARRYALSYNAAYEQAPKDCTNFASQALLAGGWQQVGTPAAVWDRGSPDVWYYSSGMVPWSYTWGGAANFANASVVFNRSTLVSSISSLGNGDIVQVDKDSNGTYDHTMIVTQTPSTVGYYALSYHSTDRLDATWTEVSTAFRGRPMRFYKITNSG